MKQVGYIVDCFDRYNGWDKKHAQFHFQIGDSQVAIYEVEVNPDGTPVLDVMNQNEPRWYYVYDRVESALEYVKALRRVN